MKGKKLTTKEFIEKAKKVHGEDTFDFSQTIYTSSKIPVTLICKKHGPISMYPASLLRGSKCKFCSYENKTITKEEFLKLAKEKYGNKYEYDLTNFKTLQSIIIVVCKKHGPFKVQATSHLNHECSSCYHEKRTSNTKEFIERANLIYGEDLFDYSLVKYEKNNKHVIIKCKICQKTFKRTPKSHLSDKSNCPHCSNHIKLTTEEFIERANLIYGEDLFDYSLVKYERSDKHVTIKCKKCNKIFKRKPSNHLSGKLFCPHCSKRAKLSTEEFIKRSIETHDDRYSYEKSVYINVRTRITITCKFHGDFTVLPHQFMKGSNCPICNCSKGELKIKKYLETNNINFIKEYVFDDCRNPKTNYKLPFDFYLPTKNLAIEFDGTHHHKEVKFNNHKTNLENIQYRDSIKNKYCEDNNIKLIRIPYWEMKNIETILEKELNI